MQFVGKNGKVRKRRDIKPATKERTRNYLVSELNYHTKEFFTEYLLATEMKNRTTETYE